MAAATQGYLQNPSAEMSSEALIIKEHVLRLVSRFICQDFNLIGNEAMRIVIHLVLIEVSLTVRHSSRVLTFKSGGGEVQMLCGSIWMAFVEWYNFAADCEPLRIL